MVYLLTSCFVVALLIAARIAYIVAKIEAVKETERERQ
jgi:hypothetical protein